MKRTLIVLSMFLAIFVMAPVRLAMAQTTVDPTVFKLDVTAFPPNSSITVSQVETNDLADAPHGLIVHFDPKSYAEEGRLTGYYEEDVQNNPDAAGQNHPVFTLYLVSIYGTRAEATAAFNAQKAGYDLVVAHPTSSIQTSAIPLTPGKYGDGGQEAEYVNVSSSASGILDQSELFFARGPVLVQEVQFFFAVDLDQYGKAAFNNFDAIAARLDQIIQQAYPSAVATPSPTATTIPTLTPTQTPPPSPTPTTHRPGKKALLTIRGSGNHSSKTFKAPSSWKLKWSYNCAAFGSKGNFIVAVLTSNGHHSSNQSVNQLGKKGHGTENYHHGGKFYLEVTSECAWTVVASK